MTDLLLPPPAETDAPPAAGERHRRRAWLAFLLGLYRPLGHLYAGRAARGMILWTIIVAADVLALVLPDRVQSPAARLALLALVPVLTVLVALDAAWCARRQPAAYTLRPYNRWWAYLLAVAGVVAANLVLRAELETGVHAFSIPSGSMAPTLLRGDYVMFVAADGALPRGAVVAYRRDPEMVVHRVAGVPGDVLEMRGGRLRVNGREAREPYAVRTPALAVPPGNMEWQRDAYVGADRAGYAPTLYDWGPLRVPEARYFVLGDNRGETIDSRLTGFVDRQDIVYRASWIYYSKGADGWRWSRFGRSVR